MGSTREEVESNPAAACYRRCVTRSIAALLLAALAGCSNGSDGAVSVRWRIVDLTTGANYDPRMQVFPENATNDLGMAYPPGSCGCLPDGVPNGCSGAGPGWEIDSVRLRIIDPVTNVAAAVDPGQLLFACNLREATTPFVVPPGRYALSLEALDAAGVGFVDAASTPAPTVRDVKEGEIVNLDVVELGVHPNPSGVPDGGTD
jgi:hypothetical protein